MSGQVELLAPAGSREGLLGAIRAGADAVYLAGTKFGARAYAANFTDEELIEAIHYAHLFGVRVYLTVNILTKQPEMQSTVDFVVRMYEQGLDGVIVQDLGLIRELGRNCPGLLLHASTQMSVTGPEAAAWLRRLGVSRIVPARELSLDEIRTIKREEPVEIEAFIHGAMCYSYSGRCLMSGFLGGRSGNRGRCAGPCRLPYTVLDENHRPVGPDAGKKECYPISMRDMCTLEILPDLIDAGIDSFKIEGRMKKPEYAAGVTALYRKYIDRFYRWQKEGRPGRWQIDRQDLRDLKSLYIRSDLSQGYYHQRNGRGLITITKPGYAGSDEALLSKIRKLYLSAPLKRPVDASCVMRAGEPATLTVQAKQLDSKQEDPAVTVTVTGEAVMKAQKRPVSPEEIKDRLSKTGESPFVFEALQVEADDDIFIPVGKLNALRRSALETLQNRLLQSATRPKMPADTIAAAGSSRAPKRFHFDDGRPRLWAQVVNKQQLCAALHAKADAVILDGAVPVPGSEKERYDAACKILALPDLCRIPDRPFVLEQIERAKREHFDGILIRSLEELELVRRSGYDGYRIADSWLYAWNRESSALLLDECSAAVLPLELTGRELWDTFSDRPGEREIVTVYGRLPLMLTAGCLRKTEKLCRHAEGGFWYLKDRKGAEFPVRNVCSSCHNVIYNSVPLSLHRFYSDKVIRKAQIRLCSFTVESQAETERILKLFGSSDISEITEPFSYTAGHFRNRSGVL